MNVRRVSLALSRLAVAALSTVTVVACGAREPATDAERLARGRQLVEQMSAHLAAAEAVAVTTTEVRDVVRGSGKKETVSQTSAYTWQRPDRFHVKMTGGLAIEAWYGGKVLTIASHNDKVFAQAPMPENIDRTLDVLSERYDMALPLADLFHSSPASALLSETTTGGYAGTENVGSTPCHHLAFRDIGVEWELWLPTEGEPRPARFRVTQKARTGQPVTDVTFTVWTVSPQITDSTFDPNVPDDYEGIAVVQRAAAVKNTAPAADDAAPPAKK